MNNIKKNQLIWLVASIFTLSVALLVTLDGLERSDWLYIAAFPAVMVALWMQYRNLFSNSKDA
ncbi:hypothetical protein ACFFK7_06380 [Pseudoalteromonas xiamenensis]|uniref:hypothetical protein n=1 Tax=Pseudoalteromonas xiamenensis TaxID=882626 RepID=UPI0035E61008